MLVIRTVLRSVYVVAKVVKPIFCVALRYPFGGGLDNGFQRLAGADLSRTQPSFELAEGESNGVKTGRAGRQVQRTRPAGFDQFGPAGHFVGRQVVERHDVAGDQGGDQHLLQVGGKNVAVDGPAPVNPTNTLSCQEDIQKTRKLS